MPEHGRSRGLHLVPDLQVELSSDRGAAVLHLHGDADEIVLDVDHPAVLLQHGRDLYRGGEIPVAVRQLFPDLQVSVRSQGRALGRIGVRPGGSVRLRPTRAGVVTLSGVVLADARARLLAVGGPVLVALLILSARRRRHRRDSTCLTDRRNG